MKMALITGITTQDRTSLAESLLENGYYAQGIQRRSSLLNTDRINHFYQDPYTRDRRLALHYGEVPDSYSQIRARSDSYLGSGHDCIFTHCCQTVVSFCECGGKFA
jgi:GDP-D-mannose dehydratase